MTAHISLDEAAHRLHKNREETLALGRNGAFAGCFDDDSFKTVDPISLDLYIERNRHPGQRPLIPTEIAARSAWTEAEETIIRDCQDRYEAIATYRLEFPNSHRADSAIGKHWYRMRAGKKSESVPVWRRWFHRIIGWLPRRAGV